MLLLQETNIQPQLHLNKLDIPQDWVAVCTHRPHAGRRKGVGVMTLIRRGQLLGPRTTVDPIYDHSDELMDILAVKLRGTIFVNVYVRVMRAQNPASVLDTFLEHLCTIGENHENLPIVVAGDFNVPRHTNLLVELLDAVGFQPVYGAGGSPEATHHQGGVLDWVFVRGNLQASPLDIEAKDQDHAVLRTTLDLSLSRERQGAAVRYNWGRLKLMSETDRKAFFQERDELAATSTTLCEFRTGLQRLLSTKLGLRRCRSGALPRRWMTKAVNTTRLSYRRANDRFRRHPSPLTLQAMRNARALYKRTVRKRKRQAEAELASRVDLGFGSIHHLFGPTKKDPGHQAKILPNIEKILEFWTDQFSDPEAIPAEALGLDFLLHFTPDEVSEALGQLDPKKATGEDDIRADVFKETSDRFLKDLARLYTREAQAHTPLPDWMKVGAASILYKHKGPKADPGNYRVIIINSFLAKLYEKMLDIKGRELISHGDISIAVEQGGFMPHRSTHDSLFILESLRDAQVNKKHKLYAAFLDMRKAFDTVNHKKFIELLRTRGTPESWVTQLIKMLAGRKMTLLDALVSLEVGTAQGSPISPLLFILFINPLIERLRACQGIKFAAQARAFIRCLLFADDICLLAQTTEDLQRMLDICNEWTLEFGMNFNTSKCELIQLAGSMPQPPPVLTLAGSPLSWVSEVKYLGVPIIQGRRSKLSAPLAKMWKSYYCIKTALSSTLPVSIQHQLLLITTNILSIALYPSAVRDMHYKEIDRFVNKSLCRIIGCPQRWTSASLLRAELGVASAEYYADRRALSHLWHLHNKAWFRNHLADLCGTKPLQRLEKLAQKYDIVSSDIGAVSKEAWKARIKKAIHTRAETDMNTQLSKRGLPVEVEPRLKARPYVLKGGPNARSGFLLRWELLHHHHTNPNHSAERRSLSGLKEKLLAGRLPRTTEALRVKTIRAVIAELSGEDIRGALPAWAKPHLEAALTSLSWPNQTKETLQDLLEVVKRVLHAERRAQRNQGEHVGAPTPPATLQGDHPSPPTPASAG